MSKTSFTFILIALILTGCKNESVEHFENGGSLKCVKKGGIFSDDKIVHVNNQNSEHEVSITSRQGKEETFEVEDGVFDTSIDTDDCTIE